MMAHAGEAGSVRKTDESAPGGNSSSGGGSGSGSSSEPQLASATSRSSTSAACVPPTDSPASRPGASLFAALTFKADKLTADADCTPPPPPRLSKVLSGV